ncbi:ABC transporter ATP-binding protein [Anditalea andensis]|uniref:ABC transporter ATP-binding protein n=1 Tax=Anditalea andensis TaxID=1048983 RepID=A0A074L2M5_9BACT|nr:ATP-binding cassette domain-containing protein [Anditalea andensis]KEO74720.1 ABC transporter ATP-binding protein [Anditalea andensis]
MLGIKLDQAGKRYQYEWIFKSLSLDFEPNNRIAVTGSNGSGKSTLLKCVAGLIPFTEGKVSYHLGQTAISEADIFSYLAISAPYMELPEEFTLIELLHFHFKFKNKISNVSIQEMMDIMYLNESKDKQVQFFSSGMKQRLKLGLCFFSDVPLLLLDEPTSNLDQKGVDWYLEMLALYGSSKSILICSNDTREYANCHKIIEMENFKIKRRD